MAGIDALSKIKSNLETMVGEKICLRINEGRKKFKEETGVLEKTYPNIFVIKVDELAGTTRRISCSYADILTSTVELKFFDQNDEQQILCAGI